MMTNIELMEQASKHSIPLVAVYSKDKLPKQPTSEGGYIINLQDSVDEFGTTLDGTHWVCCYLEKNKQGKMKCVYFDSFGMKPPIAVQNFLRSMSPYLYNNDQIQNLNSGWCGSYCLYTIWFLSRHKHKNLDDRFKLLLSQFKDDEEKNLTLLKKYMKRF